MKCIRSVALSCSILLSLVLPTAFATHRTGGHALPELLVAGDFNGDGNLDLAVHVTGFDMVAILLGDGHGNFTLNGHIRLDTLPRGLAAADINGDGKLDLINCNAWGYNVKVLLGDGLGGFNITGELNADGGPVRLLVKDFNNDGRLDIAVNAPDEGEILIYFGDGKGGFVTPAEELEDIPESLALAAGDFNSDANLDIATTTHENETEARVSHVAIFEGNGAGKFTRATQFRVGQLPTSLQSHDMNKDGIPDLLVAGAQAENTEGNYISTFLGDGAGNFSSKQTLQLGAGISKSIAVGDFDEDGNLDVAFAQTGLQSDQHILSQNLLLFFGDGTGNLVACIT